MAGQAGAGDDHLDGRQEDSDVLHSSRFPSRIPKCALCAHCNRVRGMHDGRQEELGRLSDIRPGESSTGVSRSREGTPRASYVPGWSDPDMPAVVEFSSIKMCKCARGSSLFPSAGRTLTHRSIIRGQELNYLRSSDQLGVA